MNNRKALVNIIYDVRVKRLDPESDQTVFVLPDGQEKTMPKCRAHWHEGKRGAAFFDSENCTFREYPDQRLHRRPDLDALGQWCWMLDGLEDQFWCKSHLIPGPGGAFIKDQTRPIEVMVPPELEDLCRERGLSEENVLRGFIADLCDLMNYVACPREDGYSSNGGDERMLARQWFDRAYPDWNGSGVQS
jgi:hypothetical protein